MLMANRFRTRKKSIQYFYIQCLSLSLVLGYVQTVLAIENDKLYDLSLDQLVNVEVSSASRFKQKSSEAPSAVDVVTADDIKRFGWRNLSDALNAMRGLYVRNDRNYSYLGNRGFSRTGDYNARVLIMIDGRRMNDAVFDQGLIGEDFMLDMNLIERIEYIPGSGSSVYGANALLGVINVITKQGNSFNGLKVSGEVGSFDTYRGRATFGKQWSNGADLLINGSHYFSHGQDQLYYSEFNNAKVNINNGIAQDMDQERNNRVFGKFSYGDFTLRSGYVDRYKHIPTASYGAIFNHQEHFTSDQQFYVDLDYNTQINDDLELEVRGFHHWFNYYGNEAVDMDDSNDVKRVINHDVANTRWWGGEIKLTGLQFDHHKWVAGVEVQRDELQHQQNYDLNPDCQLYKKDDPNCPLYNDSNRNGWRAGVYGQDEWRITDNLMLNAGLRLDYHHMIKTLQLHPRIGLIWDVTPTFTTKLLYGSAFRTPNAYERDYDYPGVNKAYLYNKEELVYNYEATAEWYPGNGLKLLGTAFYNDMRQVLIKDPTSFTYENTGVFHTYGFELGGEKRWDNGRLFKLTWTHNYTRDENLNGGSWAQDSPKNLVKLHYSEPLFNDQLLLGFEEIFVDQRRTLKGITHYNTAPSYHLLNINLSHTKPWHGFQGSLGIYNVLDQHYKVLGGDEHIQDTLAMDGRTVRFRLEYGF